MWLTWPERTLSNTSESRRLAATSATGCNRLPKHRRAFFFTAWLIRHRLRNSNFAFSMGFCSVSIDREATDWLSFYSERHEVMCGVKFKTGLLFLRVMCTFMTSLKWQQKKCVATGFYCSCTLAPRSITS